MGPTTSQQTWLWVPRHSCTMQDLPGSDLTHEQKMISAGDVSHSQRRKYLDFNRPYLGPFSQSRLCLGTIFLFALLEYSVACAVYTRTSAPVIPIEHNVNVPQWSTGMYTPAMTSLINFVCNLCASHTCIKMNQSIQESGCKGSYAFLRLPIMINTPMEPMNLIKMENTLLSYFLVLQTPVKSEKEAKEQVSQGLVVRFHWEWKR